MVLLPKSYYHKTIEIGVTLSLYITYLQTPMHSELIQRLLLTMSHQIAGSQ